MYVHTRWWRVPLFQCHISLPNDKQPSLVDAGAARKDDLPCKANSWWSWSRRLQAKLACNVDHGFAMFGPHLGGAINGGTPIAGWFTMANGIRMDRLGVRCAPILGTPNHFLSGCLKILKVTRTEGKVAAVGSSFLSYWQAAMETFLQAADQEPQTAEPPLDAPWMHLVPVTSSTSVPGPQRLPWLHGFRGCLPLPNPPQLRWALPALPTNLATPELSSIHWTQLCRRPWWMTLLTSWIMTGMDSWRCQLSWSIYPNLSESIRLRIHLSIPSIHLFIYPSIHLSIYLIY